MFVRNAWYVAAWAHLLEERPLARRLLGEPVVLFRDRTGRAACLEDRCCHRAYPLSRGLVVEGNLQCGYHGLEFDAAGRCVRIPGQESVPPDYRVQSYPVAEQDGMVWVWMGEPAAADASRIVRFPYHDDPAQWPAKYSTSHIRCGYRRIIDNLLDLSHLAYVHRSTIGGHADEHARAVMNVTPRPEGVHFIRWMLDSTPPALYTNSLPFKGNVDRWLEFEFLAPGAILQFSGGIDAGTGAYDRGRRDGGFALRIFHGITPETGSTSHYFFSVCMGFRQDDLSILEMIHKGVQTAYGEDVAVLEAQEERMAETPGRPLLAIRSDAARVHADKVLERLIREGGTRERTAAAAGAR